MLPIKTVLLPAESRFIRKCRWIKWLSKLGSALPVNSGVDNGGCRASPFFPAESGPDGASGKREGNVRNDGLEDISPDSVESSRERCQITEKRVLMIVSKEINKLHVNPSTAR